VNVVVADDDVADINPDTPVDARVIGVGGIALAYIVLPSIAQRIASTTLWNSTSNPSPAVWTMRPLCRPIVGSITSARIDLRRPTVPSSSAPISRE
jgi:hypothetical protein